jgi:hypothetical protein
MEEPFKELARRDAKAIRGSMAIVLVALVAALAGLFAGPVLGAIAMFVAVVAQLNVLAAWLSGPRFMSERRPVLSAGVLAGIPFALGAYEVFDGTAAIIASIPAAAIATIVLGMTIAGNRS